MNTLKKEEKKFKHEESEREYQVALTAYMSGVSIKQMETHLRKLERLQLYEHCEGLAEAIKDINNMRNV